MSKIMLMLVLVALMATAAFAREIPWADRIIHTDPVLMRGLGPEMVTEGYTLATLTEIGRDGEKVTRYESWTSGRSGGRVECAFRPGEAVEAKKTGVRTVNLSGRTFDVETWEAKRLVRCGNPTAITFYRWFEIKVVTKTVTTPAPTQEIKVHADVKAVVKIQPIDINAHVDVAPILVNADVNIRPIKVDLSAQPAPNVYVTNVTNNLSTQNYASGQMMGIYGATSNNWSLMSVGVNFVEPTSINVSSINNNANSNTNVNANTNAINIGDGSASGTTTGSGDSTATSGTKK